MTTETTLHGDFNEPLDQKKLGNVGVDDISTNESRPYVYGAGKLVVSGNWIGQAYNQFTKDAPQERPGKK